MLKTVGRTAAGSATDTTTDVLCQTRRVSRTPRDEQLICRCLLATSLTAVDDCLCRS